MVRAKPGAKNAISGSGVPCAAAASAASGHRFCRAQKGKKKPVAEQKLLLNWGVVTSSWRSLSGRAASPLETANVFVLKRGKR